MASAPLSPSTPPLVRSFSFRKKTLDLSPPIQPRRIERIPESEKNDLNLSKTELTNLFKDLTSFLSKLPIEDSKNLRYVYTLKKRESLDKLNTIDEKKNPDTYKAQRIQFKHFNAVTNFLDGVFLKKPRDLSPCELTYIAYKDKDKDTKEVAQNIIYEIVSSKSVDKSSNRHAKYLHIVNQIFYTFDCIFTYLTPLPENLAYTFSERFSEHNNFWVDLQGYIYLCQYSFKLLILNNKLNKYCVIPDEKKQDPAKKTQLNDLQTKLFQINNSILYLSTFLKKMSPFSFSEMLKIDSRKTIEEFCAELNEFWDQICKIYEGHKCNESYNMLKHYKEVYEIEERKVRQQKSPASSLSSLPSLRSFFSRKEPTPIAGKKISSLSSLPDNDRKLFHVTAPTVSTSSLPGFDKIKNPRKVPEMCTDVKDNDHVLEQRKKASSPEENKLLEIEIILNFLENKKAGKQKTPLEIIKAAYNKENDRDYTAESLINSYTQAPFLNTEHKLHADWFYSLNQIYRAIYTALDFLNRIKEQKYDKEEASDDSKKTFNITYLNHLYVCQHMARSIIFLGILSKLSPDQRKDIEYNKKKLLILNSELLNFSIEKLNDCKFNGFHLQNTFY